ncbi:unnamed protein product [Cladocopium goreaui]|uniref:Calmodulin n=1 Tax=Cladocopium goreaui TaxID=2562237 RepID=A0A9P1C6I7_9DINO|nr:unnamed protein product [Cladocopium goreaui]
MNQLRCPLNFVPPKICKIWWRFEFHELRGRGWFDFLGDLEYSGFPVEYIRGFRSHPSFRSFFGFPNNPKKPPRPPDLVATGRKMADLIGEQIGEFYDTFKLFDEDRDGKLSLKEFGTLLSSLGQNPTEQELQEWIGGDGEHDTTRIDFQSFLSLMSRKLKETDTEEELIEAFKVFDRDRDGFISGGELRASMTNLGERLNDTEVDEMIHEADLDGDGLINYDEFVRAPGAPAQYRPDGPGTEKFADAQLTAARRREKSLCRFVSGQGTEQIGQDVWTVAREVDQALQLTHVPPNFLTALADSFFGVERTGALGGAIGDCALGVAVLLVNALPFAEARWGTRTAVVDGETPVIGWLEMVS